jgi:hypothetical protein
MEIWKDIIGYEGQYQVSNLGRVRSLLNNIRSLRKEPLIRKLRIGKSGYYYLNIFKNQELKTLKPHRLVAEYFIDKIYGKDYVNHIDGDKLNNKYTNLEWVTPKENYDHSVLIGKQNPIGSSNHNSKLKDIDVLEIRRLYENKKYNQTQLAKKYSVTQRCISLIVRKEAWKHI